MTCRTLYLCLALLAGSPAIALSLGDTMPDFVRPGLVHQANFHSERLAGQVLYVDFWASWCGPCRVSLPAMNQLYREFREQGFTVVAVNVDKNPADGRDFLKKHPVNYPVVKDDGSLPRQFGVKGMPTAYLIDRNGTVRSVHEGFRPGDKEKLRAQIMHLLREDKP